MRYRALIALAVIALSGLAFGVFTLLFEKVEWTERTPPRGRAAVDPYYALELVLRERGFEVVADASAPDLLREVDAVFWLAPEEPGWEVGERFLEGGVVVMDERYAAGWASPYVGETESAASVYPGGLELVFDEDSGGTLALLPSGLDLSSFALAAPGRAEALAEILAHVEPGGSVWIVRRVERTHLLAKIFGEGLPALIALLALLGLAAQRSALRVGPILKERPPGRRSFLEHLEAVGHFSRRHGGEEALLRSARREVLARFVRLRPELAGLGGEALVERLAEHVSLDRETLRRALVDSPRGDARAFVQIMNALQELRRTP